MKLVESITLIVTVETILSPSARRTICRRADGNVAGATRCHSSYTVGLLPGS